MLILLNLFNIPSLSKPWHHPHFKHPILLYTYTPYLHLYELSLLAYIISASIPAHISAQEHIHRRSLTKMFIFYYELDIIIYVHILIVPNEYGVIFSCAGSQVFCLRPYEIIERPNQKLKHIKRRTKFQGY